MKKLTLFFVACFVGPLAWSQSWTTPNASNNINNTNTGNVGIGTASPWSALDVRTNGSSGTGYYGLNVQNPSLQAWSTVNISLTSGASGSTISSQQNNLSNGANLYFKTSDGTGTTQTRMTITDAGNVGIGTTSPSEKLQIGDQFFLQDGGWKGITRNMTWNAQAQMGAGANVRTVPGYSSGIFFTDDGQILFEVVPSDIAGTAMSNSSTVTISNTGQLCIGTTTPGSNKLAVEGNIAARKVIVTLANSFPDYVFDSTYRLAPLANIEAYIHANHHLPEISSADSVAKSGLDLGSNQAALLKKIEELTLYIIQQNKKVEILTTRIQKLENRK